MAPILVSFSGVGNRADTDVYPIGSADATQQESSEFLWLK